MKQFSTISFIFLFISFLAKAQQLPSISLFSDRDIYVSGERALLKIYTSLNSKSQVTFVDLVNQQGERVSSATLRNENAQSSGFIQLPDSISSGTYLLRTYTKNSQNKAIKEIWISNRFTGLEKTKQIPRLACKSNEPLNESKINIGTVPGSIPTENEIDLPVSFDQAILSQLDGDISISIAQTSDNFVSKTFEQMEQNSSENISSSNGFVFSGKVVDRKSSQPVSGVFVYFTLPDSLPKFQYYQTGADGLFYFQLNEYTGSIRPFIQCFSNSPTQRLKIVLNDYLLETGKLPQFDSQPVTSDFKEENSKNIDVITFSKVFNYQPVTSAAVEKIESTTDYPYYGILAKIVDPHLFVDLPNFTEISKELLPGVKFRNYNNEPTLRVFSTANSDFFTDMPLTLIDGVPVRDLNVIKDMGTESIKRVEIGQAERFYGDLRFQGVVAIITTKGDHSQIKETDQCIRPKIEAVQTQTNISSPDMSGPNIPDLRQVLYWEPSVKPAENLTLKFKTSTVLGKYRISILARLKDGTIISNEKHFEVK
jgi:hypothetical protein